MRKNVFLLGLGIALIISGFASAQERPAWAKETKEQKEQRMAWWTHDRFGMFIHWGLYALPARHEWVKQQEKISDEDYRKYFEHFNPDLYNPKEWAARAGEAGMKYVVLTAKHHEGFCLWDSKYTDYKVTRTPYGKDLLKPLSMPSAPRVSASAFTIR
jgi:alpha-L-fucosidase